jgi:hypothetical protein
MSAEETVTADGLHATRADLRRLWEEFEQLHAAGDSAGALDAADVAQRRERWLEEQEARLRARWLEQHPGYDHPPCTSCSSVGTVPFDVPELDKLVWRCAHHAAAELKRQAEADLLAGMTPAEVGAYRADQHAAEEAAALEHEREPRDEEFEGTAHARHLPGHTHTRVFVGRKGTTRARAGVLITRAGAETDWLLLALECGGFEVHHERTEG